MMCVCVYHTVYSAASIWLRLFLSDCQEWSGVLLPSGTVFHLVVVVVVVVVVSG